MDKLLPIPFIKTSLTKMERQRYSSTFKKTSCGINIVYYETITFPWICCCCFFVVCFFFAQNGKDQNLPQDVARFSLSITQCTLLSVYFAPIEISHEGLVQINCYFMAIAKQSRFFVIKRNWQ